MKLFNFIPFLTLVLSIPAPYLTQAITSSLLLSSVEYREDTFKLAKSHRKFISCLATSTHKLRRYEDVLKNLMLKLTPGYYNEQVYGELGIPFEKLGEKYKECSVNIPSFDRQVVESTLENYFMDVATFNYRKKEFEIVKKSLITVGDSIV